MLSGLNESRAVGVLGLVVGFVRRLVSGGVSLGRGGGGISGVSGGACGGRVSRAICSWRVPGCALTPFPFVWSGRRYLCVSISSGSVAVISGRRSGFGTEMTTSGDGPGTGAGSSGSVLVCDLSDLSDRRLDSDGMRAMAPFQGRPRRSTTLCADPARWCWSSRLSASSGSRPGSRWIVGGGGLVLRDPKPRAFNRAARPGEGLRTRWAGFELLRLSADICLCSRGKVCCWWYC